MTPDAALAAWLCLFAVVLRDWAVPRGYEELVWILRKDPCPPGLTVSDGLQFTDAIADSTTLLGTVRESNFEAGAASPTGRPGKAGCVAVHHPRCLCTCVCPRAPGRSVDVVVWVPPRAAADFAEAMPGHASGDDLKSLLATLRRMRQQVQARLAVADEAEVASIKRETEALLATFPSSMLAVAREFLSLRSAAAAKNADGTATPSPTPDAGAGATDGAASPSPGLRRNQRSHLASITESLLGMIASPEKVASPRSPGGVASPTAAAGGAGGQADDDDTVTVSSQVPTPFQRLKKCTICFTADVSAVYTPCGHAGASPCCRVLFVHVRA